MKGVSRMRQEERTALLVIDVQNAVMAEAWDREGVVSRIVALIERAREARVPVIFVQHDEPEFDDMRRGSEGWQFVPELPVRLDDIVIAKQYPDAFAATDLAETLEDLGAGHLVLAGAETDACIRATFHRALGEGYDVTLVADCHTTSDRALEGVTMAAEQIVAHTNMYARYTAYPDQMSRVASHDQIDLAVGEAPAA